MSNMVYIDHRFCTPLCRITKEGTQQHRYWPATKVYMQGQWRLWTLQNQWLPTPSDTVYILPCSTESASKPTDCKHTVEQLTHNDAQLPLTINKKKDKVMFGMMIIPIGPRAGLPLLNSLNFTLLEASLPHIARVLWAIYVVTVPMAHWWLVNSLSKESQEVRDTGRLQFWHGSVYADRNLAVRLSISLLLGLLLL